MGKVKSEYSTVNGVNKDQYIDLKEFVEDGYLQEVNRQFFNPLGLALQVAVTERDTYFIRGIIDHRNDPEGLIYDDTFYTSNDSKIKRDNISKLLDEKAQVRQEKLGFIIQPVENELE